MQVAVLISERLRVGLIWDTLRIGLEEAEKYLRTRLANYFHAVEVDLGEILFLPYVEAISRTFRRAYFQVNLNRIAVWDEFSKIKIGLISGCLWWRKMMYFFFPSDGPLTCLLFSQYFIIIFLVLKLLGFYGCFCSCWFKHIHLGFCGLSVKRWWKSYEQFLFIVVSSWHMMFQSIFSAALQIQSWRSTLLRFPTLVWRLNAIHN